MDWPALKDAVRWGLIIRNPMEAVDPPRVVDAEMVTWNDAQARTFLNAARDHPQYAMWVLLLTTGLRRGEVAAVRWDDLDLDQEGQGGAGRRRADARCPRPPRAGRSGCPPWA